MLKPRIDPNRVLLSLAFGLTSFGKPVWGWVVSTVHQGSPYQSETAVGVFYCESGWREGLPFILISFLSIPQENILWDCPKN